MGLKFGRTIVDEKMKITWIPVTGQMYDLSQCLKWIHENKTMWVIEGTPRMVPDNDANSLIARIRGLGVWTQQFGFRCAHDAVMFKLYMSNI